MARAIQEIDGLCGGGAGGGGGGAPIEVGKLYTGRVTGIKDFGCFVECTPGKEGLVHISELADFRVRRTEDVVKMGEMITVKCIGIDERTGKVRLSRRAAMQELEAKKNAPEAESAPVQS
jgi:polyribonucleotide nucleotidyltransferase